MDFGHPSRDGAWGSKPADPDPAGRMVRLETALLTTLKLLDAEKAKIAAVRALHRRAYLQMPGKPESRGHCAACIPITPWPCQTVVALEEDD